MYDNINTVTNFTNQTTIIGPNVIGYRHNTLQSARQELTEMLLEKGPDISGIFSIPDNFHAGHVHHIPDNFHPGHVHHIPDNFHAGHVHHISGQLHSLSLGTQINGRIPRILSQV